MSGVSQAGGSSQLSALHGPHLTSMQPSMQPPQLNLANIVNLLPQLAYLQASTNWPNPLLSNDNPVHPSTFKSLLLCGPSN